MPTLTMFQDKETAYRHILIRQTTTYTPN